MGALKNVIYIENSDYQTLVTTGTVTIGGTTLTYDSNNLYVTPDKLASSTEDGLMSASDKSKLDGIASGAEVNVQADWNQTTDTADDYIKNKPSIPTVSDATITIKQTGIADQTFTLNGSAATITLADTNTTYTFTEGSTNGAFSVTPSGGSAQTVNIHGLGSAAYKSTGTSSGNVPVLNSSGKLDDSVIPSVAITDTYEAASEAAMLALSAQKGDICIRSDLNKSFVLSQTPASTLANWKELKTPTDAVLSVNGETGAVTLDASDVGALPSDQAFKTIKTSSSTQSEVSGGESVKGSGDITLHKVSKTGSYNDLLDKPTIDNNNQKVKAGSVTFGANDEVNIVAGDNVTVTGLASGTGAPKITISATDTDTGATSVETTGSGNAVTTASYNASNRKLTLSKGSTFLTSESDTLGTVLNRGNTATTDINFDGKDWFNAGTRKTTYSYSTSQTPNTQYYWFQITPPTSNNSDRYFICVESDVNYPIRRGTYLLDIANYSNGTSYNVSLHNLSITNTKTGHLLNCAIDASGNVYIQANAAWTSYLRFIRTQSNSTAQAYTSVGSAAFGTVSGFTSLKMIQETGTIRLYNGAIDTSTSNTGFSMVDAEKFRENGTVLEDKYVPQTRTINSKALSSNITLTASDVGALASSIKYAGASTAGGAATSAEKLTNTSKIGDTNKPVYFTASGVPAAISYTIDKSVPSNAVFTDTNYYHTPSYSSGLKIGTGTGVNDLYVPDATTSQKGVLVLSAANLNTMINELSTGSSTPSDNDYYISQYAGGGTTTTTYHRRPISALYTYIKNKLDSSGSYITTGSTGQSKIGNLTLTGNIYIGDGTNSVRAVGDAPYQTKFLDFDRRTGVLKHFNVFSGVGDHFYNADKRSNFTIRTTFKGSGSSDDVYKADFYTYGIDDTGAYPSYLFDWNLNSGWQVLPSKVSTSTPAIIEVKCTSRLNYTDVLRLVLTGHNGYDGSSNYSGTLTDYTIEVCTDYTNDTWVTVVNRNNVTDKIGLCPQYSLQTNNYTACFGIRLTITGCSVTGSGYAYIKITSMQLRNHRPDFNVPESVGALSLRGGTIYGDILMGSNTGNSIRPTVNNKGSVGSSSYQFNNIYGKTIYENGTSLADKYLGKTAKAADADKLDGNDSTYFQKALPTTSTAGQVLKSTSTSGTVEWGAAPETGVTSVATGAGLTGGTITSTGTIKANLVNETKSTNAATYTAGGTSKFYAVQIDKNDKLGVYVPWSDNNDNYYATSSVTGNDKTKIATGYSGSSASTTYDLYVPNGTESQAGILQLGTTATTAAKGNHTHTASITSGGSSPTTLSANTTYTLTAGGSTVVFKTPANDGNTNYYATSDYTSSNGIKIATGYSGSSASTTYDLYAPKASTSQAGVLKIGTTSSDACAGNDSRLSDARTPTSHSHGNITNSGTITSTAVTSATGVLVYDSSNKIQRATAANARTIIGAQPTVQIIDLR